MSDKLKVIGMAAGESDEEVRFSRSGLGYKVGYKSGRASIAILKNLDFIPKVRGIQLSKQFILF